MSINNINIVVWKKKKKKKEIWPFLEAWISGEARVKFQLRKELLRFHLQLTF